jgi:hypothetical protein
MHAYLTRVSLKSYQFEIALSIYCIALDCIAYYVSLFYSTPFALPLSTHLNLIPLLFQIIISFLSASLNKGELNRPPSFSFYIFLTLTVFPALALAIFLDTSPLLPLTALVASLGACTGLFASKRLIIFRDVSLRGLSSNNMKLFALVLVSMMISILIFSKNISLGSLAIKYEEFYDVRSSFVAGNETFRQLYLYFMSPLAMSFLLHRLTLVQEQDYHLGSKLNSSFLILIFILAIVLITTILMSMTIGTKFGLFYLFLLSLFSYLIRPLSFMHTLLIAMRRVCMNYLLVLISFTFIGLLTAFFLQYDVSSNIIFHSLYPRFLFAEQAVSHHVFMLMGQSCIDKSCSFLQAYDGSVAKYVGQTIWDPNTTATLNSIAGAWVTFGLFGVYASFLVVQYLFSSLELLVLRKSYFFILPVLMCYSYLLANLEIPSLFRSKGFIFFLAISILIPSKPKCSTHVL